MKISTNFSTLAIKLVGIILLVSALTDYLFSAIPIQITDQNWQINFTNSVVDRGLSPLLGIVFLIIGWWINDNIPPNPAKPVKAGRIIVFILSSVLGLLFLILVPLHLSNVSNVSAQFIAEIDQRASVQEQEIQGFIERLDTISRNRDQVQNELNQINQVIESGGVFQGRQLNPEELQMLTSQRDQLQQLLELSENPEALNERLEETRTRLQTELRQMQEQEKRRAQTEALKQTLGTGVKSFMLCVGYIALGWLGLRGAMNSNDLS